MDLSDTDASSDFEASAPRSAEKPAEPSCPLADAMFEALGDKLDAGEAERELFAHLEQSLWTGNWIDPRSGGGVKNPLYAKQRLQRLLSKTTEVRLKYHTRLADVRDIPDRDCNRSLTEQETSLLHNAWMNDVSQWMSAECLAQHDELLSQAEQDDAAKGKGKGKYSAAKPASKGKDKGRGSLAHGNQLIS